MKNGKRSLMILLIIILMLTIFLIYKNYFVSDEKYIKAEDYIVLNKPEVFVKEGDSYNLYDHISTNKEDISWTSSDENVVIVDEDGNVKGLQSGSAIITVNVGDIKEECIVNVTHEDIYINNVVFNTDKINISEGEKQKLTYTYQPVNATVRDFKFISSDDNIASVDQDGVVVAKNNGIVTIMIEYLKDSNINDSVEVEVYKKSIDKEPEAKDIVLPTEVFELELGSSKKISASVLPKDAKQSLTYSSGNKNIVSVDKDGNVHANAVGTSNITLTTINGIKKDILVIVKEKKVNISKLSFQDDLVELLVGGSISVIPQVSPQNANNYNFVWESSNKNIATVNNGNIVAISSGTATIKVTDKVSNLSAKYTIKVNEKLPRTIVLENFDNVSDVNKVFSKTDLSQHGIIYPSIHIVDNEIENFKGMYFDFRESKSKGWAQIYNFSKNIPTNFSKITNEYYIRFWISNGNNDDLYITVLPNNGKYNNYIDASKVKLTKYNGASEQVVSNNQAGYGDNSSVKIPKGFKGWVSFPLKYFKSNDKIININDVRYISFDVRPDSPTANTYYVIDNLCLSLDIAGDTKNIKNEIDYKTDLVGMFYTVWFDFWEASNNSYVNFNQNDFYVDGNIYNISENKFGPTNSFHYWGRPQLGYYTSTNQDVIRKHMQMINDAGVDFLFVDFTNLSDKNVFVDNAYKNDSSNSKDAYASYYENNIWYYQVTKPFKVLLDTMKSMVDSGEEVPELVLWVGNWDGSMYAIDRIYNEYFKSNKYSDLWLYYENKPLLMTTEKIKATDNRFTYRNTWALYELKGGQSAIGNNEWTWREKDNTIYGKDSYGNLESMSVNTAISTYYMSVFSHVVSRNHGLTFYNQWVNVFDKHPKITLVGTWNEWGAQRLNVGSAECKDKCFTDQYNQEYSNDIEPMAGGHGDQYYKWLIQYVNAYKSHNICPRLVEFGY